MAKPPPKGKPLTDYVPFYRDSQRAWGAVNRILAIPCAIEPALYVEAAVKGLWKFGYSVISPDPKEFYHQAIGNSLYHDIKNAAEQTHIVSPRDESLVTKMLFTVADLVDVALWYGFLFGSAVDGLVDYSTQLQRYSGCQNKHNPNFFSGGPYINAIGDDGNYYADDFSGFTGDGRPVAGPASFMFGGGFGGFAAGTCAFTTFGGGMEVPSITSVIGVSSRTIYDSGKSDPNTEGAQKLGHAFYRNQGSSKQVETLQVESSYVGGDRLPLGEAFRDGDKWFGYSLQTHPGGS